MAALVGQRVAQTAVTGCKNRVLGLSSILSQKSHQILQAATIVSPASYRPAVEKPAPWPYKQRKFTVLDQIFSDSTEARLDENSKVIVVDGNVAVGKTKFAEELADALGFYLVPHSTDANFFWHNIYEVDMRWTHHALAKEHHFYDLRAWLTDKDPRKGMGAKLQLLFYKERLRKYAHALHHLLSTGQGVVIERSPFSDQVFAEAMRTCNFMSRPALKYYLEFRRQTIFDFWKPHLTIYLDAPTHHVMDKIRQRNHPEERGSKVLTDQFVTELDRVYKNTVLPEMKRHGEVLVYDCTEMEDMEVVVEDIERLNLDWDPNDEKKFQQWHDGKPEDILSYFRRYWGSQIEMNKLFNLPPPWHIPEMMDTPETVQARKCVLENYARTSYEPGYNPNDTDVWTILLRP